MKFQAWNTPALDKEENTTVSETTTITEKPNESEEASREDVKEIPGLDKEENTTVSETTNMPTIENPDESEASPEDVTPPWGCIENKEAWLADLKYICEEAIKREIPRAMDEVRTNMSNNAIEERPANEENDYLEEVKEWAVKQKQSMIID